MPGTPKSTPKKAAASTPVGSPSTSTPGRMTRAQARASGVKVKTPSPLKSSSTPRTPKTPKTPKASKAQEAESPSKTNSPHKVSPKKSPSPAKASPGKVPASHAKLARKPTSALATAQPIIAEDSEDEEEDSDVEVQEEEDEEEESDLEDGQDVSEKGMQRLMAALGDDGLDEVDMAALDELAGDEDDEDDEDEEDEDEEDLEEEAEEDDEEDAAEEVDDDIPRVKPNANGDTLAASIARSGLVPVEESDSDSADEEEKEEEESEDEEEAIAYEDLPDDIELSEAAKASRVQRIKVNNEAALRRITSDISLDTATSKLPWIETMRIVYPSTISSSVTDVENDLERELAFYKQALHAAVEGRKLVESAGVAFSRPSDYFAEMVKTDEHMERIRQKLLDETAAIKASEAAKKQRELKKFGKKVQVEKLQERIRNKKQLNERIAGLKRKHGDVDDDEDQFDVRLEEAIGDKPKQAQQQRKGREASSKAKMPRTARDAKYGFGGKKKYSKSNTAESTNDFGSGPTRGARGSKPKISGKAGFRPKQKSGAAKRPGKARRAGH